MAARNGVIVFFDLVGYSTGMDPVQEQMGQGFMAALRETLTEVWQKEPVRDEECPYLILPTGDGAAVIIWDKAASAPRLQYSALQLAARILAWAKTHEPSIGIRCGINEGMLDSLKDPYGMPNVCGAAINMAARIMDAADSGQILAEATGFCQRLAPNEETLGSAFQYHVELDREYDVLAKHDALLRVRNITATVRRDGNGVDIGLPNSGPKLKWSLQVEPPKLSLDEWGMPPKKLPPVKLLTRHHKIAFVGATHHQLAPVMSEAVAERNGRQWESVDIFFLADDQLAWMVLPGISVEALIEAKQQALSHLTLIVEAHAERWRFYEYDRPFYFASYWDWEESPDGRIHVSPYIWGQDISVCPALDYVWKTRTPTKEYRAYRDGLGALKALCQEQGGIIVGNY